ncbi:MAG: FAD-binding oxidoreductase, partial [Thermoanaerobaculia bacterium]|nr:FAD-binding oxidoreductase [Thermoanaerobaculia bacterium]
SETGMTQVLIVGGGIVGTAVAAELTDHGYQVQLITDRGIGGGATGAGMGHLMALDGEGTKADLTHYSLRLWHQLDLPPDCGHDPCGALWVAENESEMETAAGMQERYRGHGVDSELVPSTQLAQLEPELRSNLAGGLRVPSDSVIYPPNVACLLWREAASRGAQKIEASVVGVDAHRVHLEDGRGLEADWVVVAAGDRTPTLLPEAGIRPRKGHLLITTRGPRFVSHQIIELGYVASTGSRDSVSVACNVQPRSTGQVLIGSSRQEETHDPAVEPRVLEQMLRRSIHFFPRLRQLTALRVWTGFRAATEDGAPSIGVLRPGLAVATGHEGLGITQSLGTARLLRQLLDEGPCDLDPTPFDPRRFLEAVA